MERILGSSDGRGWPAFRWRSSGGCQISATRVCTDGSGDNGPSGAWTCYYEPFGEFRPGTTCSVPTVYRFAGMEWDGEIGGHGLYHTWFRQYDPSQGRWMGVDPLAGSPDDPQTFDRYTYVSNDPINLIDPLGLEAMCYWEATLVTVRMNGAVIGWFLTNYRITHCDGEADSSGRSAQQQQPTPTLDPVSQQALGDCIKQYFNVELTSFTPSMPGRSGQFVGKGTDSIRADGNDAVINVTHDVTRFTTAQLSEIAGKPVWGLTLEGWHQVGWWPRRFTPYVNYGASDLHRTDLLNNQVHELAHSLASITGVATPPDAPDSDIGDKLVDCWIQGRLRKGRQ